MAVPVYQGIFVYDGITRRITAVAKTPTNFDDFLYWVFSGKPPGTGNIDEHSDGEPARWRSAAFAAVSGRLSTFQAVFKADKNTLGVERERLRAGWLAITASMLNATTSESWAGAPTGLRLCFPLSRPGALDTAAPSFYP